MPEIFLYGISVLFFAGLAVMVYGYTTAPDGYEDEYGFHYGRPPKVRASRRRAAGPVAAPCEVPQARASQENRRVRLVT